MNIPLNELMVSEAASSGSTVAAIRAAEVQLLQGVVTLATVRTTTKLAVLSMNGVPELLLAMAS